VSVIRTVDMLFLDELFAMESGYVLDFTNRTFATFFANELNVDIEDDAYSIDGTAKARRLRRFLKTVDDEIAARTLEHLWEYRTALRRRGKAEENISNANGRLLELINRLRGGILTQPQVAPAPAFDTAKVQDLKGDLISLSEIAPQQRGFAFERFLKKLFGAYNLTPQDAFRNIGEQIDGSFLLGSEVYLLEAKWQANPVDAAALHTFHGKIEQKARWARGLFVSHSGFSEVGLEAFGRGKSLICMDGLDLFEALDRSIPLNHILERKVRSAAETGKVFIRVRDLFSN
jgi:restriction endonuclease Mrr